LVVGCDSNRGVGGEEGKDEEEGGEGSHVGVFWRTKKEESDCGGDETSVRWRVCMSFDYKRKDVNEC